MTIPTPDLHSKQCPETVEEPRKTTSGCRDRRSAVEGRGRAQPEHIESPVLDRPLAHASHDPWRFLNLAFFTHPLAPVLGSFVEGVFIPRLGFGAHMIKACKPKTWGEKAGSPGPGAARSVAAASRSRGGRIFGQDELCLAAAAPVWASGQGLRAPRSRVPRQANVVK